MLERLTEPFMMYRGLPRSIYILFFSRIVNTTGAFVRPFLAIFLTSNLGISDAQAGIIVTLAIVVNMPGTIGGGWLSDRIGRRWTLLSARTLAAACYVPCAFLGNSMVIPALLIASSFSNGVGNPASQCMIADLTTRENRKEAFSLIYLGINIGFSLGPLIAGFLYNNYIEWIFLGDAFTTFISVFLIYRFVPETYPKLDEDSCGTYVPHEERPEVGSFVSIMRKRPFLVAFTFINMLLIFVLNQNNFALPLQLKDVFGMAKGPQLFGIVMSVNGLVVVIMTVFLTRLTRSLRPILNISLSGVLFAVGYGILFIATSFTYFIVSTVIWTLGEILNATNSGVYIANHTPMSHRGRFNAFIGTVMTMGVSASPMFIGFYIEAYSLSLVWPLMFAIGMAGAGLMFALYALEKRRYASLPP